MNLKKEPEQPILTKAILWLMTIGAGLVVANIYYNQPLLGKIAAEFHISEATANNVAMITQIGYAMGLLLLIPLGDMFKRRPVIIADFIIIILSLLAFAISQTIEVMMVASFLIGFCSVVPQMFVPIAAQLSKPNERGKNVGIVMSGLLIGILASRVVSGIIGEYWGWREMYYLATVIIGILGILIVWLLPELNPTFNGSYKQLMRSLLYYFRTVPILRLTSLRGALAFGSFLAFWTTLTFHLEKAPFYAGSNIVGLLGLVGIGGALTASLTGRFADKTSKNKLISFGLILMIGAWACFGIFGFTYMGLIVGIFLIDVGLQSVHVTSQTIIFSLNPAATNRFNTIYMTCYFIGGSLGTFLGGRAWVNYGWLGVVGTGIALVIITLLIHIFSDKKTN